MRRKIAKRRRRDILALGGVFEKEEWSKENYYLVYVRYERYEFHAAGKDELEAYQTAIWSMKYPLDIFKIEGENV